MSEELSLTLNVKRETFKGVFDCRKTLPIENEHHSGKESTNPTDISKRSRQFLTHRFLFVYVCVFFCLYTTKYQDLRPSYFGSVPVRRRLTRSLRRKERRNSKNTNVC